jgi:hypothetical protein
LPFLIQILLPLADNAGKNFPSSLYQQTQQELTEKFKGLTAYTRAPAEGLWKPRKGTQREDVVVYEVVTPSLQRRWWTQYRRRLQKIFRQETVLIRAQRTEVL